MEKNNRLNQVDQEFREFMAQDRVTVPTALTESVLSTIRSQMNPSGASVFLKLLGIHLLVGFATLTLCPQFGISLTSSMGLMQYLMHFGESVCMLGCGILFMGLSFLVASLALRPEEVKVLRRNRVLQIALLAPLSLGAFLALGGEVEPSMGMVWSLGAIVGGSALLQIGWSIRRAAIQANV